MPNLSEELVVDIFLAGYQPGRRFDLRDAAPGREWTIAQNASLAGLLEWHSSCGHWVFSLTEKGREVACANRTPRQLPDLLPGKEGAA